MYSNNDWRNYQELYHHGILGMKWGVQNGPPYPLDAVDHNASEKKAGWRRSLSANIDFNRRNRDAQLVEKLNQKINKLDQGIEKADQRGKTRRSESLMSSRDYLDRNRKSLSSQLTPEELEYGRRTYDMAKKVGLATVIGGPIAAGAYGLSRVATGEYKKDKESYDRARTAYDAHKAAEKQYLKDLEKANQAKTDEEHDRLTRQADERLLKATSSLQSRESNSSNQEAMSNSEVKRLMTYDNVLQKTVGNNVNYHGVDNGYNHSGNKKIVEAANNVVNKSLKASRSTTNFYDRDSGGYEEMLRLSSIAQKDQKALVKASVKEARKLLGENSPNEKAVAKIIADVAAYKSVEDAMKTGDESKYSRDVYGANMNSVRFNSLYDELYGKKKE